MTKITINGIEFHAADGEPADMGYFSEGHPKANDLGEMGMVEEMKAFIRVQDEHNLRNLIDVGALFGVFSLVFTRYPDAKAWAVEPSELALEGLIKNVELNQDRHISIIPEFLGEKDGGLVPCGLDWRHLVANMYLDRPGTRIVKTRTIDALPGLNPDCIKIDVEGYECSVLRGAKETIARHHPILFIEAHLQSLTPAEETPEALYVLLTGLGYRVCKTNDEPLDTFAGRSHARVICYPEI